MITVPVTISATTTPPMTADNLVAYLEQQFPGLAGPNQLITMEKTIAEFGLDVRYPTIGDLDRLFTRTAAARASVSQQVLARPNVQKQAALTQTQQLNFALFLGDPAVYAIPDFNGDPWLKQVIDTAKSLVTP